MTRRALVTIGVVAVVLAVVESLAFALNVFTYDLPDTVVIQTTTAEIGGWMQVIPTAGLAAVTLFGSHRVHPIPLVAGTVLATIAGLTANAVCYDLVLLYPFPPGQVVLIIGGPTTTAVVSGAIVAVALYLSSTVMFVRSAALASVPLAAKVRALGCLLLALLPVLNVVGTALILASVLRSRPTPARPAASA